MKPFTIDRHSEARQRIASEAAAAESKSRQLEAILHPVRIAETYPADRVIDLLDQLQPKGIDQP